MSERSTGSSQQGDRTAAADDTNGAAAPSASNQNATERSGSDQASTGGSSGNGRQESAAERTSVIAEPVHGRSSGAPVVADDESAPEVPDAPRSDRSTGGPEVPPWQRGGTAEGDRTIDVGREQHGGDASRSPGSVDAPTQRTYAFSDGPGPSREEAPTGSVPLITDPVADDRPRDDVDHDQPTVRAGQPMFENSPPAAARPSSQRVRSSRAPRRASLQLKRLDPWSVLKLSLVLSVAGFLVWMVAVGVLYSVLGGMGVWDQLNGTYSDLTSVGNPDGSGDLISAGRVFGVAAVVGVINIVLFTALATVGSFIYNVSSDLAGGVELTLSERD